MGRNKNADAKGRLFAPKISLPEKKKSIFKKLRKGTPLCICAEASYMAESAVALPFFAGFMLVLLFFFQVLTVQQEVGNALFDAARRTAALECKADESPHTGVLAARAFFIRNIPKDSAAESFIRGGRGHILLSNSDLSGNYVFLQADYKIRLPFGLFGNREIAVTQKVKCRKWTGSSGAKDSREEIVFVTPQGNVYHRKRNCSYLEPIIESVSKRQVGKLRNADGGKYYSCVKCMKNKKDDNITVYIAKYGNRYHGNRNCSRIKRTVFAVRLSEVQGKRGCSKCGRE